jgi:hypothetical protein
MLRASVDVESDSKIRSCWSFDGTLLSAPSVKASMLSFTQQKAQRLCTPQHAHTEQIRGDSCRLQERRKGVDHPGGNAQAPWPPTLICFCPSTLHPPRHPQLLYDMPVSAPHPFILPIELKTY